MSGRNSLLDRRMTELEFNEIYDRNAPLIWFVIGKYGLRGMDAEDVFVETWEAVNASLSGFRGQARLSTWLAGIARHKCADFLRARRPDLLDDPDLIERLGEMDAEDWPGGSPPPPSPARLAVRNEVKAIIREALDGLGSGRRLIVEKWMAGFQYHEIAEIINAAASGPVDTNYVAKELYLAKKNILSLLRKAEISSLADIWE